MTDNKDLDRNLEILRSQMQRNNGLTPTDLALKPTPAKEGQKPEKGNKLVEEAQESKKRGYNLLLEELAKGAKNDHVSIEDDEPVPLSAFKIDESTIAKFKGKDLRLIEQDEGRTILDIIGYTENMVTALYVAMDNLIDEKRFDDAIDALKFLIGLAPYITLFWKKLAEVYYEKEMWDDLVELLKYMVTRDPEDPDNYTLLLEYALGTKDYDKPIEIMEQSASESLKEEIEENINILKTIKQGGK